MAHLLTKHETAVELRITIRTLERWIREGRIAVVKLSPGTVRVDRAEVDRLLEASR